MSKTKETDEFRIVEKTMYVLEPKHKYKKRYRHFGKQPSKTMDELLEKLAHYRMFHDERYCWMDISSIQNMKQFEKVKARYIRFIKHILSKEES